VVSEETLTEVKGEEADTPAAEAEPSTSTLHGIGNDLTQGKGIEQTHEYNLRPFPGRKI
jgi:hypothetical protein